MSEFAVQTMLNAVDKLKKLKTSIKRMLVLYSGRSELMLIDKLTAVKCKNMESDYLQR